MAIDAIPLKTYLTKSIMNFAKIGYYVGTCAAIVILLWLGIFKFTPTEAMAIKPYVATSFLMSWMYDVASLQFVSNFIGVFEIITALLLIGSFWSRLSGLIAGYLGVVIFSTTLTFLISAPGIWTVVDGVPTTDFFVLKDLAFLAIFLIIIGRNAPENQKVSAVPDART